MGLRHISTSRLVATFLAAQTALTSVSPLALGQDPAALLATASPSATWALTSINEHLASIFEVTRESDGQAVSMGDLLAGRAVTERSDALLIRTLTDDILPTDFVYRLSRGILNAHYLGVHRTAHGGTPDAIPLTGAILESIPTVEGSTPTPEQLIAFLESHQGFLVSVRTLAGLERNYSEVASVARSTRDSTTMIGLLGMSLILIVASVGSAMLGTKQRSLHIARALMVGGVVLAMTASMSLGNLSDHARISSDLADIDSKFDLIVSTLEQSPSDGEQLSRMEQAMTARANELLASTHVDQENGHLKQRRANTSLAVTSVLLLLPIVAVTAMSQTTGGKHSRLTGLAPAIALIFGMAAALWATAPTRAAVVRTPESIRGQAEAEIENLLGGMRR